MSLCCSFVSRIVTKLVIRILLKISTLFPPNCHNMSASTLCKVSLLFISF